MPHALIVDDSKTARYALRLLLDKQNITADMVESGEQALEYLHSQTPDLIFMDHMMPGMDGFQAVKAIKSNSATTSIPIVMYTSTQGGVYFGQARALGAADVISKPASAEHLSAVLARLEEHHLLGAQKVQGANKTAPEPEPKPSLKQTPKQQRIEIEPVVIERATAVAAAAPQSLPPASISAQQPIAPAPSRWPAWLTALSLIVAVATTMLYFGAVSRVAPLQKQRALAFKTIEWALNRAPEFPYGEPPFGGERLTLLQNLVQQLNAAGFKGQIRLESHVGQFCLLRQPSTDGSAATWTPAQPNLHITDCSALGQSNEESRTMSAAQSAGFKRFLSELPAGIQIELVPLGAAEPKWDYPSDPAVSAGQWNAVAQHNQRVQIVLVPD